MRLRSREADTRSPAASAIFFSSSMDSIACVQRPSWAQVCPIQYQACRFSPSLRAMRSASFSVARASSPFPCSTWSLAIPAEPVAGMSFADSFAYLDRWAVEALRGLGVDAGYRPLNDIVSPAGKIAGAAQARRRGALLHHVTMAYSMDQQALRELIRVGRPTVTEKGVRSADKVVSPLDTLLDATREEVVAALADASGAVPGRLEQPELEKAADLVAGKYARREWIHRLP